MPTAAVNTYTGAGLVPAVDNENAVIVGVRLAPSLTLPAGCLLGIITQAEVQSVTLAEATGGYFTLTYATKTTGHIDYLATGADVQAALEALTSIGAGNVTVTGDAGGPYTVTFAGTMGNIANMTADATNLTSGTTATVTVANVTQGTPSYNLYGDYAAAHTDGTANPVALLKYAVTTDSNGLAIYGDNSGGRLDAPAYVSGIFQTADLPQSSTGAIDATALTNAPTWRLLHGSTSSGLLQIG